jgi:redox-sensitive bicupin YhaK (pirin superfamily)
MTAGSGLVHEEMHGEAYSRRGGPFEMVQLWVNLPARSKMTAPRYQEIRDAQVPAVSLPDDAGVARIIAGAFGEARGPAETHTPLSVWDVRLRSGKAVRLPVPAGHNASVFVLDGSVTVDDATSVTSGALAVFDPSGEDLALTAASDAKLLVLAGEPIREPIAGYGPFVMNTPAEIHQALDDFRTGKMGRLRA